MNECEQDFETYVFKGCRCEERTFLAEVGSYEFQKEQMALLGHSKACDQGGNRDQLRRARWAGGHESGPKGGQGKDGTYGATMPLSHFYPDPPDWLRCAPDNVKSAALSLPLSIPRQ